MCWLCHQAYELVDGECEHAEHAVTHHLCGAADPDMATTELVLETAIDALTRRTLVIANLLGKLEAVRSSSASASCRGGGWCQSTGRGRVSGCAAGSVPRHRRRCPYMSRTASRLVELEAPFGAAVSEITRVDCHTDNGRALQPVLTSPPVSVRTDRGVTVPARGSDDPAPRTGRPTGPCVCRAGSGDPDGYRHGRRRRSVQPLSSL